MNLDYQSFEYVAVHLKEQETDLLRSKAELCHKAVEANAKSELAALWGCSKQFVQAWADVWLHLGPDEIYPDVPLSLYRAALDTDDPWTWLQRALNSEWSARQLRDAADVSKGKHISQVDLVKTRADVTAWEPGRIELSVPGWEPSGDRPAVVEVRAREVLTDA